MGVIGVERHPGLVGVVVIRGRQDEHCGDEEDGERDAGQRLPPPADPARIRRVRSIHDVGPPVWSVVRAGLAATVASESAV